MEVEKCPTTLPPIPASRPRKIVREVCEGAFGAGAICYDNANATTLGLLLDALGALYLERKACEHGADGGNKETLPPPSAPRVP